MRLEAFAKMAGVPESSGIVASRARAGLYWTHSDSGGRAALYPVDATGALLGPPVTVAGATNVDWEDIAADERGNLWIADIGNNLSFRTDLCLWVVPEPEPAAKTTSKARRYAFHYPDQSLFPPAGLGFDAEALFLAGGRAYILSKQRRERATVLYRLELADRGAATVRRLGSFEIGGLVTAADASPDGKVLAVLTYEAVWLFRAAQPEAWFEGSIHWLPVDAGQCEALALDRDGSLLITNEAGFLFRLRPDDLVPLR